MYIVVTLFHHLNIGVFDTQNTILEKTHIENHVPTDYQFELSSKTTIKFINSNEKVNKSHKKMLLIPDINGWNFLYPKFGLT